MRTLIHIGIGKTVTMLLQKGLQASHRRIQILGRPCPTILYYAG
jgi:hypothetical protein